MAPLGHLAAQDTTAPPDTTSSGLPTTPQPSPAVPANGDQSQNNSNSQSPDNPQQTPPGSTNPSSTNSPLLPFQGVNPNSPFDTSSTNPQSSQLTTPSIYTTGGRDLSQTTINNGLAAAFSVPPETGYLSDQRGGFSHAPIERLRIGPFDLKATVLGNSVTDDNLNAGQMGQGKQTDTSFSLTPAFLLVYGLHDGQKGYASLVYAPSFTRFIHQTSGDSNNQNVAFTVQYPFPRLTLDMSATYTQTTGYNTDLNSRTTQSSGVVSFGGSYPIDDKLSFSSHVQQTVTSFSDTGAGSNNGGQDGQSQGQGDTTTSINSSLSYHLSDKMSLSTSANFGVDKAQDAPQDTFEQGLLGISYQPTVKISLFANGGIELRQSSDNNNQQGNQNGGSGNESDPIFSAGIGYSPFDSTSMGLSANQSIHTSSSSSQDSSNQTVINTGVTFSVTQRFFQRFYVDLDFDYSHQEDQSGNTEVNDNGTGGAQDSFSYRAGLSYSPTAWSAVAIYYQYLDNQSSDSSSSSSQELNYHDNQFGVSASVQF